VQTLVTDYECDRLRLSAEMAAGELHHGDFHDAATSAGLTSGSVGLSHRYENRPIGKEEST
jgi:hypothetical protein